MVIPTIVMVVGAAATGAWAATRGGGSSGAVTTRTVTYTVATTTLKQTVSETGTLAAADTEDLNFSASGRVTGVKVAVGTKVSKGQVLATIDSASLRASAAQAAVSLENAKSRLSSDETSGASSAQLTADSASVDAAGSQLEGANAALSDASLVSPIAGTVTVANVTVGQQLGASAGSNQSAAASSGSSSSTPQFEVISPGYVVNVNVDATVVDQIKKGNQATITPTGATQPIYGTVSSIGLVASVSSGVATFPIVIAVTGIPNGIYAGTSSTVAITYKQLTDIIAVPVAAITTTNGQATVELVSNGKTTPQDVTTGSTIDGQTEITRGLQEGDVVSYKVITLKRMGTGTGGTTGRTGRTGTGFGGGAGTFIPGGGFGGGGVGGGGFVGRP